MVDKPKVDKFNPVLVSPTLGSHVNISDPKLPGYDGLPYYGPQLDLKATDRKQPKTGVKAHVDIFQLNDEEQLEKYRKIVQMVANGYAQISREEQQYDQTIGSWRVFIRWLELFAYMPEDK